MIHEPLQAPAVVAFFIDQIDHQSGIEVAASRAIMKPPVGVKPIVVSTDAPCTAAMLAPFPRCAITMRAGAAGPSVAMMYS